MAWSGHHMIDPSELEARFSTEDGMAYMASIFTEPTEEALGRIQDVLDILDELPPREADFIDLYYFKRLNQTEIAALFGVSQPTVCYRLKRAAERIKYLIEFPAVDYDALNVDLKEFLAEELDVHIMELMIETTCQSEVAKRLGVSQGLVRHRFIRTLKRLTDNGNFDEYVKLFCYVRDNLNIMREVQRPSSDSKVTHALD